jgi:hypothetical protein
MVAFLKNGQFFSQDKAKPAPEPEQIPVGTRSEPLGLSEAVPDGKARVRFIKTTVADGKDFEKGAIAVISHEDAVLLRSGGFVEILDMEKLKPEPEGRMPRPTLKSMMRKVRTGWVHAWRNY